jgi:DNA/RNA-binding domain of Phe-tRNA-synthetase-like protein
MRHSCTTYSIAPEIFEMFPGYVRGVVIAQGVKNGPSPGELIALLRAAEEEVRSKLDLEKIIEHPNMASWREAYRRFGAKPGKFRPSMEAMARRVLRDQELPSISRLVDIGNIISLKHLVPAGGHAIDVVEGDMTLCRAKGNETFEPFGSDEAESPEPGEIVFCEGKTVLTRRWTWRQANHTLVTPETTALEFNIDGLPPVTSSEVEIACREVISLTEQFCGGKLHHEILTREIDRIPIGHRFKA